MQRQSMPLEQALVSMKAPIYQANALLMVRFEGCLNDLVQQILDKDAEINALKKECTELTERLKTFEKVQ